MRFPGTSTWKETWWVVFLGAAVVNALLHAWVADDIYVTFRYCDQLLAGNGPVYNPGERSEGYTHFLWFLLLTIFRALQVPAEWIGRFVGIPFYAATLWILALLSRRLFAGRSLAAGSLAARTTVALPIAALAWAAHADARLFASGGLETAGFTFLLVLGFYLLVTSLTPRRQLLAAWAFATACLVRPDGLLFLAIAMLFVAWRNGSHWRLTLRFVGLTVLLIVPLLVFRLYYYGYPFPNPYYAKSGNLSYWSQGWHYLSLYLMVYSGLLLALPMTAWSAWRLRPGRGTVNNPTRETLHAPALLLAACMALAHMLAVTRAGGDFMFARFYLPATPFLLLLCEALLQSIRQQRLRTIAAMLFVGWILAGGFLKEHWLGNGRHYWGIVDEPQFYPRSHVQLARAESTRLAACFEDTGSRVLIVAGQLMRAYYARYPEAVEFCGLTDKHVAHSTLVQRGRPGHEKFADADYVYSRGVHFLQRTKRQIRRLPTYAALALPYETDVLYFEIIVYDQEVLRRVAQRCPDVQYIDFPIWFRRSYAPLIKQNATPRLIRDYRRFERFYFANHPEDRDLLYPMQQELAQRGVHDIPAAPPDPARFRDFSPYLKQGKLLPR